MPTPKKARTPPGPSLLAKSGVILIEQGDSPMQKCSAVIWIGGFTRYVAVIHKALFPCAGKKIP